MSVQDEADKLEKVIESSLADLRKSYAQYNLLVQSLIAIVGVEYSNVWDMKVAMLNIIKDSVHSDTPNPKKSNG